MPGRLPRSDDVSVAVRYGKNVRIRPGSKKGCFKFIPSKQTPPCTYCGKPAAWKLDIKVSWFRGDDERAFACAGCYDRIRRDF